MAVVFKATSDFDDVVKDHDRLQRENVKLKQKMAEVTAEVKGKGAAFTSTFSKGLGQVQSMVMGYASLQGAIQLVNMGLAEQNRLSEEASRVQLSAADAQAEVVKNLGNVTTAHAAAFLKDVQEISKSAGAESVAPVLEAAAATLSGTGGNEGLTKNILSEAIPLFRNKLSELPDFAGAVADLAGIAGAESQEEIRRTMGLVLTTQSQARIKSLGAFKNVAPAMAAAATVDTGEDRIGALRESGALFAAIGGSIKDPEGAVTKTATARFATAIAGLLPEKDTLDVEGNVVRQGTGLKTLGERLARLQSDPKLQREFLQGTDTFQKATFEGPVQPVIAELIGNQQSEIAQRMRSAMGKISDDPRAVGQIVTNLEQSTGHLLGSTLTRKSRANIEDVQLDPTAGRLAQSRKILQETLEQTRPGFLSFADDWRKLRMFDAGGGGEDAPARAIASLRERERHIRSEGGLFGQIKPTDELSTDARQDLRLIEKQIQLLERLADSADVTNERLANTTGTSKEALSVNREGR